MHKKTTFMSSGSPKCNGYQSKRKAEALTMKSIHKDIGKVCCSKDCNSQLSATEVLDYRKQYHGCRQQNERQVKLMQMMRSIRCTSDKQQNYHIFNGICAFASMISFRFFVYSTHVGQTIVCMLEPNLGVSPS